MAQSVSESFMLAQRLLSVKQKVSRAVSDQFFLIHPEWEVQYGERGPTL